MQEYEVWLETDQISTGYAPCRYRVPFDARRGLPDTLALTSHPSHPSLTLVVLPPSSFPMPLLLVLSTDTFSSQAAIARVSALIEAKKEKKATPPKKVRGKKAKTFFG